MAIKRATAFKMAIEALYKERALYSGEANLYKNIGLRTPYVVRAEKKYRRINEAIEILEKEL